MTDLARLKMLLERCSPGPWQRAGSRYKVNEDSFGVGPDEFAIAFVPIGRNDGSDLGNKQHADAFLDAELIALAPTLARSLLAAKEENERLRAALAVFIAMIDAAMTEKKPGYVAGVTDIELSPGGGYMLSQARAALEGTPL